MNTKIIKTQEEMDALPLDFNGTIYVEGGDRYSPLDLRIVFEDANVIVRGEAWVKLWESSHAELWGSSHAVLRGSSHAVLRESSHAVLRESSHAVLRESSHAVLRESSHAELWGSSHAVLRESSHAVLRESSHAELWGSSHAVLRESSHAVLRESSHAVLWESSHAELWGSSHAVLRGSSHAVLWESSHAELWESSHAVLRGSSHAVLWESSHAELWESSHAVLRESSHAVLRESSHAELWESSHAVLRESSHAELWGSSHAKLFGEAMVTARSAKEIICKGYNVISIRKSDQKRINVVMNKNSFLKVVPDFEPTFKEYLKFYPVAIKGKKAIMYKAVHKESEGQFCSNYDRNFKYKIGEIATEICNPSTKDSCLNGLHVSPKSWAISFGNGFENLAILEVEVPVDKIVVASDTDGKVRTSELKVLREVPKEEWYVADNA
jgi:hypothetical protein